MCTFLGNERPKLRDLNKYVVEQYAKDWNSLGLELGLEYHHIAIISANNRHDVKACCREMLSEWLEIDISATWGKLDDAIRATKLPPAAAFNVMFHDDAGILHSVSISNMLYSLKF